MHSITFNLTTKMNKQQLLNEILAVLKTVKDDRDKLEEIHTFFMEDIYEEEQIVIPEKYKKLVSEIANDIDTGLIFYINTKTNETTSIIPEEHRDETWEETEKIIDSWNEKISIEPINSNQGYQIMENFAENITDKNFQRKLYNALSGRKPFAKFNNIVGYSDYQEDWFAYKQNWLEEFVYIELRNLDYIKKEFLAE